MRKSQGEVDDSDLSLHGNNAPSSSSSSVV